MTMRLILGFVAAWAIMALALAHEGDLHRQKRLYPTRCYPGSHCYPDQEDIANLQASIIGSVVVPSDTLYLSAVDMTNARWTRHPGIIVVARTISDVQRAVLFSRKFYMNLVYSASGMDYQGRGAYDGSMKIDLSQLKLLPVTTSTDLNNFNVPGTVTAHAGNTWGEIYSQVETGTGFGRIVAGGSPTLDSVDSFTVTGGIGPLSRTIGLASDNLLTAQIVLADGRLATVNSGPVSVQDSNGNVMNYEDDSLLKALRGGGINWGIPVSFTFGMQIPPFQYGSLTGQYRIVDNGQVVGRSSLKFILGQMLNLPVQWGGYVAVDGAMSTTSPNDKGVISYHLFSYGFYNFSIIGTPIYNLQNDATLNRLNVVSNPSLGSYSDYRNNVAEVEQHFTSKPNVYVMNTLLNTDVITNNTKLDQFVELMMDVVNSPTVESTYRCVGKLIGGKVSSPNFESSVSDKLREAAFSWTCALQWDDGLTRENYYLAEAMEFQRKLRAFGNGGVNPYYASEDLEDWRTALYGSRYHELLETKKDWDVDNFLWAHNGVASDFELNCRAVRCPHHH